jgi:hypothetical protein
MPKNDTVGIVTKSKNDTVGIVTKSKNDTVGIVTKSKNDTVGIVTKSKNATVGIVTKSKNATVGIVTKSNIKIIESDRIDIPNRFIHDHFYISNFLQNHNIAQANIDSVFYSLILLQVL